MKYLFLSLQAKIKADVPSLKKVDFYNRQFEDTNNDEIEQNKQQAIPYPNCFIQFSGDNPQLSAGAGAKRLDVLITFKIGFVSYNLVPIEMFDIAQMVQASVENFKDTMMTPLQYRNQRVCHDYTNVVIYEYDYACVYSDNIKYILNNAVLKSGVTINPTPIPHNTHL
jgi:hypothetical protein